MTVQVLIFGNLTDIAGDMLNVDNIENTNALVSELNKRYPDLAHSKYVIAVNKKMINGNTMLQNNDTVALMPPYSGG